MFTDVSSSRQYRKFAAPNPALHEIARDMELKKCRKCGCMEDALDQAGGAF